MRTTPPFVLSRNGAWITYLLLIALAVPTAGRLKAQEPPSTTHKVYESPSHALAMLQAAFKTDQPSFVVQGELDPVIHKGGGGACASAAGIDVLQTLRLMARIDPVPNPHRIALLAFDDQPDLLQGRVTNEQFVRLLGFYEKHLHGHASVKVHVVSAPKSPYRKDEPAWPSELGPDLDISPGNIKVLSYTVSEPTGTVLGRHFVLLKASSKEEIAVVDPAAPGKDRSFVLERRKAGKGRSFWIFLQNPVDIPRPKGLIFELNTVFSISLTRPTEGSKLRAGDPVSMDHVKSKFNETASQLRGTEEYLDPLVWRKRTAEFGLPGLDLPAEHGGSAWPASKMIEVFRHTGKHNLNFRDVVGGAHVRALLVSKDPKVLEVVKQVAKGEAYIAISLTEPGSGSDFTAMKSTARKVEGGFLLTGEKRFNARLEQASHVVLFTQSTTGKPGKLTAFLVPLKTPGLTITRLKAHGLTGNSFGGLVFKDLFVAENFLIGTDGEGGRIFYQHFMYWRLMQAAAAIGTGEDALRQMADRLKSRHAFGGPIGRFTHLQQQIGQHLTELRMAYALAKEAAQMLDRGEYSAAEPLIDGIKAEGVEIALKAADVAMRAFGGEGYSDLVDLGDRVRDLMGLRIADGTTDVLRMAVVRKTFGEELWKMAVEP